ncbi:hypothetical protein [Nonomuraea roseoviolacea]|uniref:Uncharacterized protein n=1 Tax=Nonomuraea roseoviolacea subsp. carminata TaxID=160689 RepID=A0ABT1JV82_9ACTN|nr:hypothetical protein [Nonomuraea roseoviolacea]MCP2345658.1 hypothetical protein [Nonomuraea roseoviolacea subsp. carminata]
MPTSSSDAGGEGGGRQPGTLLGRHQPALRGQAGQLLLGGQRLQVDVLGGQGVARRQVVPSVVGEEADQGGDGQRRAVARRPGA